jgi:nucleoid-associated protein EbfC
MFDALKGLGGMGGLGDIMRKAQEMQGRMAQVQEELARKQVSADVAGGMVSAVVNGRMELVKLRIDKDKVDLTDLPLLEDLIVAAVAAAQNKAAEMTQNEMGKMAGELGLPPGALPFGK